MSEIISVHQHITWSSKDILLTVAEEFLTAKQQKEEHTSSSPHNIDHMAKGKYIAQTPNPRPPSQFSLRVVVVKQELNTQNINCVWQDKQERNKEEKGNR